MIKPYPLANLFLNKKSYVQNLHIRPSANNGYCEMRLSEGDASALETQREPFENRDQAPQLAAAMRVWVINSARVVF